MPGITTVHNVPRIRADRRVLAASGLAHFTQDGFADMLYVFLPLWQAQFGLAFAQVGLFKMLFSGTLALFQAPCSLLARRTGTGGLLVAGTLLTGMSVASYGFTATTVALACLLVLGGLGASVQHPLSSTLISDACSDPETRRAALSVFNVSGDIGKLVFPAVSALIISRFGWPTASHAMGLFGVAVAVALLFLTTPLKRCEPSPAGARPDEKQSCAAVRNGAAPFIALLSIGIMDSATRMGFLTYFPFLLRDKGADIALTGWTLSLVFVGGIAGKFFCGIVATRVGVLRTVIITESLTAVCVWLMIALPLGPTVALCPVLGVALNGTSSVLYGSVPELVPREKLNQSFAVFYTATIGAGAVAPFLYGFLSDGLGLVPMLALAGALILVTLPLTLPLRGKVNDRPT